MVIVTSQSTKKFWRGLDPPYFSLWGFCNLRRRFFAYFLPPLLAAGQLLAMEVKSNSISISSEICCAPFLSPLLRRGRKRDCAEQLSLSWETMGKKWKHLFILRVSLCNQEASHLSSSEKFGKKSESEVEDISPSGKRRPVPLFWNDAERAIRQPTQQQTSCFALPQSFNLLTARGTTFIGS